MTSEWTYGHLEFFATSFSLASRHSKKRKQTSPIAGSVGKVASITRATVLVDYSFLGVLFSVDIRFPGFLSSGAKDIIGKMLKNRAQERISLKEIIEHPWVQEHLTPEVRSKMPYYSDTDEREESC